MKRLEIFILLLVIQGTVSTAAETVDLHVATKTIDQMMTKAFQPTVPGAAILVVKDGQTVLREGYGLADIENGLPVQPETVFRIASITKTFTAMAVLKLAECGALSLGDSVALHLPDAPEACSGVTVEQLLSHTGGVPNLFDEAYYSLLEVRAFDLINDEVDIADFVNLLGGRELDFVPGEEFSYSNGGYFLLGQIIEVISGMSYPEFISEAITVPMELISTTYLDPLKITPGRARSYLDDDGGYLNNPYEYFAGSATYAAGGLESNVDDLGRLAQMLQSEKFPYGSPEGMFKSRTTPLLPASSQYGLGTWIGSLKGHPMVWHGGDAYGFSGTMVSLPDNGIYVVILTLNPYFSSYDLDLLARQAAGELLGDPFPPRVRVGLSPEQLSSVVGTYCAKDGPTREVTAEDGRLFIQRDGRPKVEAIPSTPQRFFFEHSLSYVTFEVNDLDRVCRLILHRDSGYQEIAVKVPRKL